MNMLAAATDPGYNPRMWRSFFLVTMVWGAIYLPRLGSLELKSEEGRRVLPAVTMLQTGNYVVPQVGSEPYLRKPPLVNWLVAGSFKVFGARNEWTARLPSVLSVLAVALAFVGIARRSLGPNGSLAAAMIWLTNFGLLEKGRMIEIEALYVSLTALAFICWLSWWKEPGRRWLAWIVPWIFLGLALLAKGPLALLFFYMVVLAVLWQTQELRELWCWPHLVGLILMLAIFGAWAFPYLQMTEAGHVADVWSKQFSGRVTGAGFKFADWLLNIPRGIAYLLPWVVLLPFARFRLLEDEKERTLCRALSLGVAVPFVLVNLMPGALPRYTMPLLAPAIWLLAIFIRSHALLWPKPLRKAITWSVAVISTAMLIYSLAIIPLLQRREKIRPIAAQIDAAIPPKESLYAVDPDYQPFLFYLQRPIIYVSKVADLPRGAHYLLVQPADENAASHSGLWAPRQAEPILRIKDYRGRRVILLRVGDNSAMPD
jgi:4-amino-4-deoxy-L-arabinose transferase-like glycosyltransferase